MDGKIETQQDSLRQTAGRTSAERETSPSTTQPKTYTEAEVSERHSKLDKTIAQLTRERDTLKQESETTKQQLTDVQRRIDEQEEEAAKGSPDSLKQYQLKREAREEETRLRDERRKLEKDRLEYEEEFRETKEIKLENIVVSAAVDAHVDISKLREKVQKFGLTSKEQIEDMAQTLSGQTESSKRLPPQGDSGRTIGGTGLGSLPPKELLDEIDKKLRKG